MNYLKSPSFYGSLAVGFVAAYIFISLGVVIFGGHDAWPLWQERIVNVIVLVLSLVAGYSHAVGQFGKQQKAQRGFPVIFKDASDPDDAQTKR